MRWIGEGRNHTAGRAPPERRYGMRRCRGMPAVVAGTKYVPMRRRIPVRIGERHRRLPADVQSRPAAFLFLSEGGEWERIERALNRLNHARRNMEVAGGSAD